MLLVIGSNGFIGRRVVRYFRATGRSVRTASHRPGADLRLDLSSATLALDELGSPQVTDALLCSGITDVDRCKTDERTAWEFNVARTCDLLRRLQERGIRTIVCSSDLVFGGDRGAYTESDAREPATAYGRQKKAVEDHLCALGGHYAILRMSKLYSIEHDPGSLVHLMLAALRTKAGARFATDAVVVPTCVEDIVRTVAVIVDRRLNGVFHVTPQQRYSRYDLALILAEGFGLVDRVVGCSLDEIGFVERRPKRLWLEGASSVGRTGVQPIELRDALGEIVAAERYARARAVA